MTLMLWNRMFRLGFSVAVVLAVVPLSFAEQVQGLQGQHANFLFNLDAANSSKISNSPIGTEVILVQDGHLLHYYYSGNYYLEGENFGAACASGGAGNCHITFGRVEDWGKTDQPEGKTVVVAPSRATYDPPSGAIPDPAGNTALADNKTPAGNDLSDGQQNAAQGGRQESQGQQNAAGGILVNGAMEVVGGAGQAAITAGAATYLVEKLGGEQVRRAQENLSKTAQGLNSAIKEYDATRIATVNTGLSILARTPQFNVSIPVISTAAIPQSSNINLDALQRQLFGFDARYSNEVMRVAQELNSVKDNSEVRRATFKELGKASLRASVENRALGWSHVSDAQLKIASDVGEMLVRSLPVTGLYTSLYEVWTGKNMFNDRPLSQFERGLQGAMAVMDVVSLGLVPTIASGVRAISMIAVMGEDTAIAAAADAIPVTAEVADDVAKLAIDDSSSLKSAENLLRTENRAGKIASPEQAEAALADGLKSRKIPQAAFEVPTAQDGKLQNLINDLYKGTTNPQRIGNGTTADAIRYELQTGKPVGGTFHTVKGTEYSRALENWLRANPNATSQDRAIAQSILDDLRNALRTGQ